MVKNPIAGSSINTLCNEQLPGLASSPQRNDLPIVIHRNRKVDRTTTHGTVFHKRLRGERAINDNPHSFPAVRTANGLILL
nr:hypothetical protein [Pelagicoccus mobilis]